MSIAAINKVKALKKEKKKRRKKNRKSIDFSRFENDPIGFAIKVLKIKILTKEQEEIYLSIRDNVTTNCQAGHGVGKSFGVAAIIIWWVYAVEGVAFTTAPTYDQVNDILWKEVRTLFDRNKKRLGGRRTELSIKKRTKGGVEITAKGFSTKNYDSNAFQGKHHEKLLLLEDEADGISNIIDEAFDSCVSGSKNRAVRIGNPLTPSSAFAKNCAKGSIKIPVWNHPNVAWAYEVVVDGATQKPIHRLKPEIAKIILKPNWQQEKDPVKPQSEWPEDLPRDVIPGAVSIAWIEKNRLKYGEFSAFWMPRVEAEFPGDDVEGLIPLSWLKNARERYDRDPEHWDKLAKAHQWRIGADVADGGGDGHCLAIWRGWVWYGLQYIQPLNDEQDTVRLANKHIIPKVKNLGGAYSIAVDNTGVGAGTLATLKQQGYFAQGCKFGSDAQKKEEYKNLKTELFWLIRDGLRLEKIAIAPLGEDEEKVFEELAAIRYLSDTENKKRTEKKSQTKKRLGRSPDGADACATAWKIQPFDLEGKTSNEEQLPAENAEKQIQELLQSARNWDDEISTTEANKYLD